ncbi:MAG TPA: hypothetical protein VLA96_06030 [Terriglobales bacterium]|nr:hypothetical protein [Terriglobales bacterium]
MPRHFDYSLDVPCSPADAYDRITSSDAWQGSEVYGKIQWVQGEPWQPDSVREVETLVPFRAQHKQRVLAAHPGRVIDIMSHGMGYTNHTQILLEPSRGDAAGATGGGTHIQYVIDIEGSLPLPGSLIDDFVHRFMDAYLPELKKLCGG